MNPMTLARPAILLMALLAARVGTGQSAPNPTLNPLTFLSGRWVSEEPPEIQEENWSPVIGNSMMGSFRVVEKGKPVFYEFWAVELEDNHPVLKLKHFNSNLAGWEEKNTSVKMPLLSTGNGDAVFAEASGSVSLHYHRAGNKLTCTVHHVKDSKSSDETFTLIRAPLE